MLFLVTSKLIRGHQVVFPCLFQSLERGFVISNQSEPIVFIVDDEEAARLSMSWLVESIGLQSKVYSDAQSFLDDYSTDQLGCLLLDVYMPGMSGLELQQYMFENDICCPTIFITGHANVALAIEAIKKGGFDFLEKPFRDQDLIKRIHQAIELDREQKSKVVRQHSQLATQVGLLTCREREVMAKVVGGASSREVAERLNLSTKTIEVYRSRVMEKLGFDSLPELVQAMIRADIDLKLDEVSDN